jgi:predicted small metal-binding protein
MMSITTTCKGCGMEFAAEDEDQLADKVLAHVKEVHQHGHTPTRERILTVIRKRQTGD